MEGLARLLNAAEDAAPVDAVSALTHEIGERVQAEAISFLVLDTSGRALVRLTHAAGSGVTGSSGAGRGRRTDGEESAEGVPFDGGPHEQVVRGQQTVVVPPDLKAAQQHWTVVAPVTERGEVIGVLETLLPREPGGEDVSDLSSLAHLLAFVAIANRRHTDLFEWGQRSRPLSLSAEIQQRLLPASRTCEGGSFTLSGWLEPAADIAGDTFDYSLARDTLHFSITDAMGHGVAAALTATLCVGALRGSRRLGHTLEEQGRRANAAVVEHGSRCDLDDFVTGLLGRLDLRTGSLQLLNAGHVQPYLARGADVEAIPLPTNLPLGIWSDTMFADAELDLEPGDRVILVTDGMLERNAASLDLTTAIGAGASLHPREAAGALADAVLAATGQALSDDATVLCLDWYGGHGRERESTAGAATARASSVDH